MWTLFLCTAFFLKILLCYGDGSKYTWPLDIVNPLLESNGNVTEGHLGCSYQPGAVHNTLSYSGIRVTGCSYSYIDVKIGESDINDFAITIHARMHSLVGMGTIFHYRVDAIAVDTNTLQIKDVILWNNETHLIAETFGPNDEIYGSTEAAFDATILVQNWIGICVSHSAKKKTRIITTTGIDTMAEAPIDAHIEQPAMLRFGSSFNSDRPSFNGDIICASMDDSKDCQLEDSLDECTGAAWQQSTAAVTGNCMELKGYFQIKQKDVVIDNSIASMKNMTTLSRVKCADLCVRTDLCWTYTLNKLTTECKIYDSDYSNFVVPATGSNYYMRRDVCC